MHAKPFGFGRCSGASGFPCIVPAFLYRVSGSASLNFVDVEKGQREIHTALMGKTLVVVRAGSGGGLGWEGSGFVEGQNAAPHGNGDSAFSQGLKANREANPRLALAGLPLVPCGLRNADALGAYRLRKTTFLAPLSNGRACVCTHE